MKIYKQARGEVLMDKKVQLNDMELNQVAGGGWTEFWKKLNEFLSRPMNAWFNMQEVNTADTK